MRNFAFLAAVAAVASAQSSDVEPTAPPMGVYKTKIWQPLVTATTILDDSEATATPAKAKRDVVCVAQPTGIAHLSVPDSAAGFLADAYFPAQASAAVLPAGYTSLFVNTQASNNADNYMGYTLMNTYDVQACGDKCSAMDGCSSFNIYFERDPSVNPDSDTCANPAGVTQIKCVWWGGIIDKNTNVNSGQWRNQFQVVIAGSNGYVNKASASVAATYVSTAPAAATTVPSTAGSKYAIYFSSDSTVGSFTNAAAASSYTDCTTACDNTASCTAFTYVGGSNGVGSGTCWLKTGLGSISKSGSNVVSGVKVAAAAVNVVSTTTTTTTSAKPTTTTTTTSSVVPTTTTTTTSAAPTTTTTTSAVPTTTTTTTTSAVPTTTTTTTTSAEPTTTPVKSSTTLSTSTTTTTSSTTTTTSAAPTVTAFYIQLDGTGTSADNLYAKVASGANGKVTFTSDLSSATKFIYDSARRLVVQATGYAANVPNSDGSWKDIVFNAVGNKSLLYATCSGDTDELVVCVANGNTQYAGVCKSDSYSTLFFGRQSQTPTTCAWAGLYNTQR